MGLFSRKPKPFSYDPQQSEEHKGKLRQLFNDAVEDGDEYHIIYGVTSSAPKIQKGLVMDTLTTSFYSYILGWRDEDTTVVIVAIDADLTQHGEPFYLTIDEVKETHYDSKVSGKAWFIFKDSSEYGIGLNIRDRSDTTVAGLKNLYQAEEREQFLDFFEKYTDTLLQTGHKFKKWKR